MSARSPTWRRGAVPADAPLRDWLLDRGSLTARLVARCPGFRVEVLGQGRRRPNTDEAALIGVRPAERVIARDVVLRCARTPLVYAHSVVAPRHLRGAWRMLGGLGARPLGAALFADPAISRLPLQVARVGAGHPLYSAAIRLLGAAPAALWARRSLFLRAAAPLLVTEVFLPAVVALPVPDRPRR